MSENKLTRMQGAVVDAGSSIHSRLTWRGER